MLQEGAVEAVDRPGPGYYSRLFLVEKVTGLEACHQFICVEQLCHSDQVQDGDGRIGSRVDSPERLDVLHQHDGRIFLDFGPSGVLTIS